MGKLFKSFLVYGIGSLALKAQGLLLVPLLTRILSQADFGTIELLASTGILVSSFSMLATDVGLVKYYNTFDSEEERKVFTSTGLFIVLIMSIAVFVLLVFNEGLLQSFLFPSHSSQYAFPVWISLFTLPFTTLLTFESTILQAKQQAWRYNFISIIQAIIFLPLTVILVAFLKSGVNGYFISAFISSILTLSTAIYFNKDQHTLKISIFWLKKLLKFDLPLMPTNISGWALTVIDRFFVLHYGGLIPVGLYSVAAKIGNLQVQIVTAFQTAWAPYAFAVEKEEHAKVTYARVLTYYLLANYSTALVLSFFAPEILSIGAGQQYQTAALAGGLLTFASFAYGLNYITSLGLKLSEKTGYVSIAWVLGAILNIILNFLLIPKYSYTGAAAATVISYLSIDVGLYILSQKRVFIPFNIYKSLVLTAFLILTCVLEAVIATRFSTMYAIVLLSKFIFIGLFAFVSIRFIIPASERSTIFTFIRSLRSWKKLLRLNGVENEGVQV